MSNISRKVMVFRPLPAEVGRWDEEQCRTVSYLAADANEKREVKWRGTSHAIIEAADEAGVPKGLIANVVLQFEPPAARSE